MSKNNEMMIKKIYAKLKTHGVYGLFDAAFRRLLPRRLACYPQCRPFFEDRFGLEIGGPSSIFSHTGLIPVYSLATCIDNCNFSNHTAWEHDIIEGRTFYFDKRRTSGTQYIMEASALTLISSACYDFVISSHVLEHIANPLQALTEWTRVLKEGGLFVLVVPHKDGTFDHLRPLTRLEHLVQDFEHQTTEGDMTHLEEILRLHDLTRDPEAGGFELFKQRSIKNRENRCLHHHVFDTRLAIETIHYMGLQIFSVEPFRPYHIVIVAEKPTPQKQIQNDHFRGIDTKPCWTSPFPSDQLPPHYMA